ncbi:methyltransferase [Georgenia sp. 10Sc9-8]|uniref:Methyltransferase n=1 Tax=Georgenia halotolerans TaxID=3028317 RepID=A0ABT5TWQ4_9MICO|nr:methyltransferase [Georgenia halotolerans]
MDAHSPTPPAGDRRQVAALRADLGRAAFTVDHVNDLLGDVAAAALHREQRLPAVRAARAEPGAAATLLRLFVLGDEVTRAELDDALERTGTDGARRLGLAVAAGRGRDDAVRALVDLRPYGAQDAGGPAHWWMTSDLGELATGAPLRPDHVLGVGGASTTLAQLTVRAPVDRTLDLGTGSGVQALHAARHSAEVIGTDVSPRALGFAAFNAALAETRVDLRHGSLLEPVAGEGFGLVVSNPPFVITPAAAYDAGLPVMEYRDGARAGDDLVRDVVTGVADVLRPGGVAQLLGNWEHRHGEGWTDRVGSWLAAAGLDGWVVQREVQDPAEYAELWLRDGGMRPELDRAAFESAYDAWLADFEARGVTGIGFGYLTLRRPAVAGRPPWRRVEEVLGPVRQPLGEHVSEVLAAQDRLGHRDGTALGAERLVTAADVTEERHLVPGAVDPSVILLRQGGGMGRTVVADTALAAVVGACDGELTVDQIVTAVAGLLEVETAALAQSLLPRLRELVLDGLLRPV